MSFAEVVLENFQKDFKELLPRGPGYLNCKIVVGYGNCQRGIISNVIKEDGLMLLGPDGFEFERVLEAVLNFSNLNPKKPSLVCVNLMIPSGTICIYRLYEIEEKGDDILLKNQSPVGV